MEEPSMSKSHSGYDTALQPVSISVAIDLPIDETPDLSYLDTTPEHHFGTNGDNWSHVSESDKVAVIAKHGSIWDACVHYSEQDAERLASYGNSWWCVGVRLRAELEYVTQHYVQPRGNGRVWFESDGWHRTDVVTTAGVWGVESDSEYAYEVDLAKEQVDDLNEILASLGVSHVVEASEVFA